MSDGSDLQVVDRVYLGNYKHHLVHQFVLQLRSIIPLLIQEPKLSKILCGNRIETIFLEKITPQKHLDTKMSC